MRFTEEFYKSYIESGVHFHELYSVIIQRDFYFRVYLNGFGKNLHIVAELAHRDSSDGDEDILFEDVHIILNESPLTQYREVEDSLDNVIKRVKTKLFNLIGSLGTLGGTL